MKRFEWRRIKADTFGYWDNALHRFEIITDYEGMVYFKKQGIV